MCKKVCPILNKKVDKKYEQKAFLFQNKKEEVRDDSTSGGFFSSICENVINKNGIVYGASFDSDFIVEHTSANNIEKINKFRKSKYVQSDLKKTFTEIKKHLDNKKLVLFSGTPCQVAGLKKYLLKEYDNLITMDIMCHSVPSPLFFDIYKKYILNKMGASSIKSINFRDKSKYGYKYSMMSIETDNGKYSEGIDTDPYLRAFFGDYSIRPSCYNCQFKTQKRVSDITIWDCFNVGDIDRTFDDDKGTTRILVQSPKGEEIIHELKDVKIKEIAVGTAVNKVKEMTNSVRYNSRRKTFFEDVTRDSYNIEKYFPNNMKSKMNGAIRKILSVTGLYIIVKKVAKKILGK